MKRQFCVQHHITHGREHDDFRFEDNGAAVSFCIPKGMKRQSRPVLAIRVQDHDLDYMDFEGEIAEGKSGAGTVKLCQRGELELIEWEDGKKLRVRIGGDTFTLIKPNSMESEHYWLLLPR